MILKFACVLAVAFGTLAGFTEMVRTTVEFNPDLAGLDWAEGSIATAFGPVSVSIRKGADGKLVHKFSASPEVTVRAPSAESK